MGTVRLRTASETQAVADHDNDPAAHAAVFGRVLKSIQVPLSLETIMAEVRRELSLHEYVSVGDDVAPQTTFALAASAGRSAAAAREDHSHGTPANPVPDHAALTSIVHGLVFGVVAGSYCEGNDVRLSDARVPLAHVHAIADVTSLQTVLDGKAAASHTQDWSTITGKPSTFAPSSHTHGNITNAGAIGTTSGLPIITTTSGVLTVGSFGSAAGTFCQGNDSRLSDSRAPTAHVHAIADVTSLQTVLDGKAAASHNQAWSTITGTPTTRAGYGITDAQPLDAELTAIAGLVSAADMVPYFTGSGAAALATFTAFGRSLVDDADAATARTTLGVAYGTTGTTVCVGNDTRLSDARTPLAHTHGNITNAGAIGSTSGLPIITTTSGVLTAGSFGSAAGTFCQGNDARLSDSRTPLAHNHAIAEVTGLQTALDGKAAASHTQDWSTITGKPTTFTPSSHTHGNITNAGAIGTTSGLPIITTTGGVLTVGSFGSAAGTFCQGNDARLSDSRAPTAHVHAIADVTSLQTVLDGKAAASHTQDWSTITGKPTTFAPASHVHGNITNAGAIGSTSGLPIITTTSGVLTVGAFGSAAGTFCQGNDSRLSDSRAPTAHVHAIADVTSLQTVLDGKAAASHTHTSFASLVIGTDPGGSELLRVDTIRTAMIQFKGGGFTGRKIDLYADTNTHMGLGVDLSGGPYELSLYGPSGNTNQGFISFGFVSHDNPGTYSQKMRLNANGSLHIGTDPGGSELLRVGGGARINGSAVVYQYVQALGFKDSFGQVVVTTRQAAVENADENLLSVKSRLNDVIARLRAHGLIAT